MIACYDIVVLQNNLILTNQRCVYYPAKKALIFSDLHLGKSAHFRKHGIAISRQSMLDDLVRLQQLINHFEVTDAYIVGDLIHAGYNSDIAQFVEWFKHFDHIRWFLIKGNHDRLSNALFTEWGFEAITNEYLLGPFCLCHEPSLKTTAFTICGHLHPGIRLNVPPKQTITLPCYVATDNMLILPAFSLFTRFDTRKHFKHAKYIVFDETTIYPIQT